MAHADAQEGKWRGNWRTERVLYTISEAWHCLSEYSYHCNQTNCFQQDCRCQDCKCHIAAMLPKVCKCTVLSWCHIHRGHPSHQEYNSHILEQRMFSLTISPLNNNTWHLRSSHWRGGLLFSGKWQCVVR